MLTIRAIDGRLSGVR